MSSYLCFLCHTDVNSATNEELREKYKDLVGVHLCPESHLCYICSHLLRKLAAFKTICLKQSLEYPVLFSEKSAINYQKKETELCIICNDNECEHCTTRNIVNIYHIKTYNENTTDYADLHDENSVEENNEIDYTDFYFQKDFDRTNNLFDNVSYNFNDKTNLLNDNYHFNDELNNQLNNYTTNEVDSETNNDCDKNVSDNNVCVKNEDDQSDNDEYNESSTYNDDDKNVNDTNNVSNINEDYQSDNDDYNESSTYNDNNESNNDNVNNETKEEFIENTETVQKEETKKKKNKSKKRSFQKILLSFSEQKAILEAQRKSKKYLEAEFKCHGCALSFLFKDTYQSHMMRHEESNGQFSCSVCGLRFATQNARCMHVILHSEIYKCNRCGEEIKRPHRARHKRACWSNGTAEASCHLCGKAFMDSNCLQQHLKRFHAAKNSKRTYSCNVCGKTYREQSAVRTHMIKHINRRFDCQHCKSSFASPYTLSQHLKTHTNDPYNSIQTNEYRCMTCNTSYKNRKGLLAHYRKTFAHQQTSFECPICNRNCPNSRALNSHMASHGRGRRPPRPTPRLPERDGGAVCHLCGAMFKGKNKLTRHLKEVCERAKMEEAMATFYEQTDTNVDEHEFIIS